MSSKVFSTLRLDDLIDLCTTIKKDVVFTVDDFAATSILDSQDHVHIRLCYEPALLVVVDVYESRTMNRETAFTVRVVAVTVGVRESQLVERLVYRGPAYGLDGGLGFLRFLITKRESF